MPYFQNLHTCQPVRSNKSNFSVWITAMVAVLAFLLLGSAMAAGDMSSSATPSANGSANGSTKNGDMSGSKASTKTGGKAGAKSRAKAKSKAGAKTGSQASAYQEERAACMSGQSHQDRSTCLKEAAAAQQAARRGQLVQSDADYQQNALRRCDVFTDQTERQACVRRVTGDGVASGSVESGGVLRESTTIVPAPAPGSRPVAQPSATRTMPSSTMPSGARQPGMTQPMQPGSAPATVR